MKKLVSVLLITAVMMSGFSMNATAENTPDTVKGVWVCSVKNLDFPSRPGLTQAQLKKEIDDIVENCKSAGLNTVFFQVRPNADALYKSDIFPWSSAISGMQGKEPDGGFDPLKYIINKAHAENIRVQAWINPYRIGTGDTDTVLSALAESNPAKKHPEYTVVCSDGSIWFNPALPEVRAMITNGVTEIVRNYAVDGIHFDDYFYPYGISDFPDSADYQKYGGAYSDIFDFRRANVNELVSSVCDAVHKTKKNVVFGISPFGIWDNIKSNPDGSETNGMSSYSTIFSDSRAWVKNGWVDYICPQVYWSFENTDAPFDKVVGWWNSLCAKSNVDLYIGCALYKLGTGEKGFESSEQIARQLELCSRLSAVRGNVFFRYSNIRDNTLGCRDVISGTTAKSAEYLKYSVTDAATSDKLVITSPAGGYKTTDAACSITGMGNPAYPLTVNGLTKNMTEHGYFCAYVQLKNGRNTFVFNNETSSVSVNITRSSSDNEIVTQNELFEKDSAYPDGDSFFYSGESLSLRVRALDGATVTARLGDRDIPMTPDISENGFTEYKASIVLPNALVSDIPMGKLTFTAVSADTVREYSDGSDITVIAEPRIIYTTAESYVYNSPFDGSMMDNYQLPCGTKLSCTAFTRGQYRDVSGKWIFSDCVSSEFVGAPVPDISTEKYTAVELECPKMISYQSRVTQTGELIIDIYHTLDTTVKRVGNRTCRLINSGGHTTAVIRNGIFPVTGYYIESGENGLTVHIYNKQGGLSGKTIVIDPGHGGDDAGAEGPAGKYGPDENALNLAMSYILMDKLSEKGAKVILTRTEDETLSLAERASLIRSFNPDLCISVHHNSVSRGSDFNSASGFLTLYSRETSLPLAQKLASAETGIANLGVKAQSLNVCRDYRYPCILLECGFVCNPLEYEKLLTNEYKSDLCSDIVLSLNDYFS